MALGGFFGAFANMIGGLAASSQQRADNEYLMNRQAELNKEQADYSTDLAKNYWDYTNFENQVKHMKEAGLNPALFYAKGGQGGSTGGGQAQGVGLPSTTPTMARIQAQGMGAQLQNILSQVELNKAVAKKTDAEADKIKGVDTQLAEAEAKLKERIANLQDTVEKVLNSQEKMNAANYFKIQAEERKIWEEARKAVVDAEVAEKTKDANIEAAAIANWKNILEGVESISRTSLNEQQIEKLKNDMAVAWANVALGEKSVSNEADRIANDLMIGMKGLDIKERELLKDWIYEGVHAGKEISGEILNWVMRGAPKTITEVTSRLEEIFDEKGIETGSKTVKQTITKGSN
jgi:hypothetical protein